MSVVSAFVFLHSRMPERPPSPSADEPSETAVARVAGAVGTLARLLLRSVKVLTGTAALAGGTLWLLLWWPMSLRADALLGAGLTFPLFLAPAAVLGLFYAGLRDLAALPDRVSAGVSETMDASIESYRAATDEADSWWGWGRRLLGRLWALRSLLGDHRALLMRYGAMLRLVTPGFLLLVVGAAGITLLLAPAVVLALVLAALL